MITARRAVAVALLFAATAAAAPPTTAPSDALDAMGSRIAAVCAARDGDAFAALFDVDAMLARALHNVEPGRARALRADMREMLAGSLGRMIGATAADSRFDYLRHRTVDGETRLLLRNYGEAGLNYWDLVVADGEAGASPKLIDFYPAISGEMLSQTMQRLALRLIPAGENFTPAEIQRAQDFQAFIAAARTGDAADALRRFAALPESIRRDKSAQLGHVIAAGRIADDNGKALLAAADEYKRRFGDDPACDLIMVDAHLTRGETAEAIACVDRVDASVGGDPYLDVMRSNLYSVANDRAAARKHAARALEREPTLFPAAEALLTLALGDKDFPAVKKWMLTIERTPGMNFRFSDDLNGAAMFAEFRASPEFAAWQRERPASK